MNRKLRSLAIVALFGAPFCQLSRAETPPTVVLQIQVQNFVNYYGDVTDWSRLAANPNQTTPSGPAPNFAQSLDVADIVSVNGEPVKGV